MSFADIQKFKAAWISSGFDSKFTGVLPFRRVRPFLLQLAGADEAAALQLRQEKAAVVARLHQLDAKYAQPRYLSAPTTPAAQSSGGAFDFTKNMNNAFSKVKGLGNRLKQTAVRSRTHSNLADSESKSATREASHDNASPRTDSETQEGVISVQASSVAISPGSVSRQGDTGGSGLCPVVVAEQSPPQAAGGTTVNPLAAQESAPGNALTSGPMKRPRVAIRTGMGGIGALSGLVPGQLAGLTIPGALTLTPLQTFIRRGLARRWWWAIFRAELQEICFKHNGKFCPAL